MQFVVIGNPENRRVTLFTDAVTRRGLPTPIVASYHDLLTERISLGDVVPSGSVIRLDSPGENADVERLLIQRGSRQTDRIESEWQPGRILHQRRWFHGFRSLMESFDGVCSDSAWMSSPRDIPILFEKPTCLNRLATAGVPVPRSLGIVSSFEELQALIERTDERRLFLKQPWGSSASGVLAFQTNKRQTIVTTSTEMVSTPDGVELYNSLRVRRYTTFPEIRQLIDTLGHDGLHVECWLPKAGLAGKTFDLRIVTIAGEPRQMVMRTSSGPLTNLHLGNQRGDLALLRSRMSEATWETMLETCRQTAAVFPKTFCLGLDVLIRPNFRSCAIIEANAFGDLLPRVWDRGEDTYTAQVTAWQRATLRRPSRN
ncbi:STM4014 family protein [Thalassoroseus pseudoceratinae]|uniref:STM4014 family protein n=1 Tax=Thalassoroseus pseudoceratinae TaxID=2713176 RepID=UPI001F0DB1AB|nr:STM4014 family protein [Thalassoroseus pseudoceratinae]